MTKLEIAKCLVKSPAWDGIIRDPKKLVSVCSKEELEDLLSQMNEAEDDYYDELYRGKRRENR